MVATYSYDAYGQMTSMSSNTTANPWRFASAYQDGTGLYKMGARYYDPLIGRFTQQDPIFKPLDPTSWNRYAYAGDDPVNNADPSGMCTLGISEATVSIVRATWPNGARPSGSP